MSFAAKKGFRRRIYYFHKVTKINFCNALESTISGLDGLPDTATGRLDGCGMNDRGKDFKALPPSQEKRKSREKDGGSSGGGDEMDINLTGQIAATLAENLKQPWYNPLMMAGAGVIGGLVTGILTLIGVRMTNKNAERREERKQKEEALRTRRDDQKKTYENEIYEKTKIYSQIRGLKETIYYNYREKLFSSIEYERYLAYMLNLPKEDLFGIALYNETANDFRTKRTQYEDRLTQNLKSLGEKIGVLITLFESNNKELNELILCVDNIDLKITLIINDIVDELRDKEKIKTRKDIDENVNKAYDKYFSDALIKVQTPMHNLLSYLENDIQDKKDRNKEFSLSKP
jgi:hypothetical protein